MQSLLSNLNREKLLAIGFGLALVLWLTAGVVSSWLFGPFTERNSQLADLEDEVSKLQDQQIEIARSRKLITDWQAASLPPDRGAKTSKRPDAIDAQRLYQSWINDMAHLAGFENISVKPAAQRRLIKSGRGTSAKNVYVAVPVSMDAEGQFSQLATFLDHFYRAQLLHRISHLEVSSRESVGDPVLKISLDAEGLALIDVPWRRSLFAEAPLAANLDDRATTCQIGATDGFPRKAPFRVRIGNEFLNVTGVEAGKWTLERGVERTFAASHTAGSVIELAPTRPGVPSRSVEEFRQILAANVFIKPPTPINYELKLGPLPEQAIVRGESLAYTLSVTGYDPTLGKPEFQLMSKAPPGLEVERGSGKVMWKPAADQPIGTFPLEIAIRHPSSKDGSVIAKLNVIFREPNAVPTVEDPGKQTVYIGQKWSLPLKLQDAETPVEQLTVKIDNPPAGLSYDATARRLDWVPAATVAQGDMQLNLTVTDAGTPPQSKTLTIPVHVADDAAQFTFLVGSVSVDGVWQAWLYNRANNQRTVVRVGDQVNVADINAKVAEIGRDFVILSRGETRQRWTLGQNLRELPAIEEAAAAPAATKS